MSNTLIASPSHSRPADQVLIFSALSSTLGVLITQPLDVLKTRLQGPPILNAHSSVGILKTATALWSEVPSQNHLSFRLRAFWAGTIPSLWRSVPGVCAYFTTVNLLQPYLSSGSSSALNSFALGFTSRCIVGTALLPFTVVKAQAEAGLSHNRSTFEALHWIYKTTKLKGIYSGLVPTLARDSPYSGVYLLFYNKFKNLTVPDKTLQKDIPTYLLGFCAFFAAFCATAVTQPADVLRSNRQLTIATTSYRTPWTQVLLETVRIDGITGLWRGFYLRLIRRSIFAMITWTLFDKILISSQSPLPIS
nr:solute carrier family 25 8 [Hymenolepis microstoma]